MKVANLKKGMVLKIIEPDRTGWLTVQHPIMGDEPELRFIPTIMASLVPGPVISNDELIIYLGHDKVPAYDDDHKIKKTVRRVMVKEMTVVVLGYNFRYLEPHPDFIKN